MALNRRLALAVISAATACSAAASGGHQYLFGATWRLDSWRRWWGAEDRRTTAEREFIAWAESHVGRTLGREERWLWIEQARAIGDLEGEPTRYIPLCGVVAEWTRKRQKGSE